MGGRGREVGWRQVIAAHGDDRDRLRRSSCGHQVVGDHLSGNHEPVGPAERATERRFVPVHPAAWVGLGDAAPEQIVDGGDHGGPPGSDGGQRGGVDHVEPGGRPHGPVVPCTGQQWSRQARDTYGMAERGERILAVAAAGETAGQQVEVGPLVGAEGVEALEQAEDIGPDPARRRSGAVARPTGGGAPTASPGSPRPDRGARPAAAAGVAVQLRPGLRRTPSS